MSLSDDRARFTALVPLLILYANRFEGMRVRIDYVKRGIAEQRRLVEAGASQTMDSSHLDGLAIDLIMDTWNGKQWIWNSEYPERFKPLGEFWERLDPCCLWGGDWDSFPDPGHFYYDPLVIV